MHAPLSMGAVPMGPTPWRKSSPLLSTWRSHPPPFRAPGCWCRRPSHTAWWARGSCGVPAHGTPSGTLWLMARHSWPCCCRLAAMRRAHRLARCLAAVQRASRCLRVRAAGGWTSYQLAPYTPATCSGPWRERSVRPCNWRAQGWLVSAGAAGGAGALRVVGGIWMGGQALGLRGRAPLNKRAHTNNGLERCGHV